MNSRFSSLFRDFATGLDQQMFFWGRDVVHSEGNLLSRTGFEKRPSTGLQGTSCYALPWHDGVIELHGSYAGWLGEDGGVLFIRPLGRCVRWLSSKPPVPGEWPAECYSSVRDAALHEAARPFLDWVIHHEAEVLRMAGEEHRKACFQQYKSRPGTTTWLGPEQALAWITGFRDFPDELARARRFGRGDELRRAG